MAVMITTLFREDSVGLAMLGEYWMREAGSQFISEVLSPVIGHVSHLDHTLEVIII